MTGCGDRGFSMVELLAALAIVALVAAFLFRSGQAIKSGNLEQRTRQRMALVEARIRQYYAAHEQLPDAVDGRVPVQADGLDMEQKYRLDCWGRFFLYDPGDVTNILDIVDGSDRYAAVLRSSGPDQRLNTRDDLVLYLDLTSEATAIVQRKLRALQERVRAYDALFTGRDNNGSPGTDTPPEIDEDLLAAAQLLPGARSTCPPTSYLANDPVSGLPTLDAIARAIHGAGGQLYDCPDDQSLAWDLCTLYHLPTGSPRGYAIDPWGQALVWGYEGYILDDGTSLERTDRRFHRFFSRGPDWTSSSDDDIVALSRE